jgi:hypothetical protein
MASSPTYVSLADVAARANSDQDFFAAVVANIDSPNSGLAPYEMQLSPADEERLRNGLRAIMDVDLQFRAFGGWGRWPRFDF